MYWRHLINLTCLITLITIILLTLQGRDYTMLQARKDYIYICWSDEANLNNAVYVLAATLLCQAAYRKQYCCTVALVERTAGFIWLNLVENTQERGMFVLPQLGAQNQ